MPQISERLNVEVDNEGDFELVLDVDGRDEYHYLTRAEAEQLLALLVKALRREDDHS